MGNIVYGTDNADTLSGFSDNNTLYGFAGNDTITDSFGNDTIEGGAGDDVITDQGSGTNVLRGGDGNDTVNFSYCANNTVEGGAGNDLLQMTGYSNYNSSGCSNTFAGGAGNDRIISGGSADTYLFNRGDGQDLITDLDNWGNGKTDKVVFGAGIAQSDLFVSRSGYNLVVKVNDPNNALATDQITIENWFYSGIYQIESLQFADGANLTNAQLNQMVGTAGNDNLVGTAYGDTLAGLDGNDVLNGNAGNDILQGGNGNDTLCDAAGTNLLDGGMGADIFMGGAGSELFVGGAGNDIINTGDGADVIAFNRNDGQDILNGGAGTDNTLSLGGGIQYSDLALSKTGNDLVLEAGNGDQITLASWYDNTANYKSVLNLQVVADAMAEFDRVSTDPLLSKSIQNFDFISIVNAFDQAHGGSTNFMHWNATNSLLAAHLSASDSEALGGDLAYQYGKSGSLAGVNQTVTQGVINAPQFGNQEQVLKTFVGL